MAFGPPFTMPGAFHFEAPASVSPTLSGVHPGLFRPPASPSASSSMHLTKSTTSVLSEAQTPIPISNAKRKRSQPTARARTPINDWPTSGSGPKTDGANPFATQSQTPQRQLTGTGRTNTDTPGARQYMLAGQIDTPSNDPNPDLHTGGTLDDSTYSDADYRRELGSKKHSNVLGDGPTFPLTQSSSDPQSSRMSGGWSRLALYAIGGVVGKVWEFCKAGAFRGFYAGGGRGYDENGQATIPNSVDLSTQQVSPYDNGDDDDDARLANLNAPPDGPLLSDSLPYEPTYYETQSTPESTPPPAAKRRQVSNHHDADLHRNWVMVSEPQSPSRPSPAQPFRARPTTRKRTSTGYPASSVSSASRAPTRASTASTAGPRYSSSTAASSGRRISHPVPRLSHSASTSVASSHRRQSSRSSHAGGVNLSVREPASCAGMRSATTIASPTSSSRAGANRPATPGTRIPAPSQGLNPFAAGSGSGGSRIGSPSRTTALGHRRTQSAVSPSSGVGARSRGKRASMQEVVQQSPRLTDEARELATKKAMAERDADARINTFNRRLQEMIRQGREALGTTVTVEFEEEDEDEEMMDGDIDGSGMSRSYGARGWYGRARGRVGAWVDED